MAPLPARRRRCRWALHVLPLAGRVASCSPDHPAEAAFIWAALPKPFCRVKLGATTASLTGSPITRIARVVLTDRAGGPLQAAG